MRVIILLFILLPFAGNSQVVYKTGDVVPDLSIAKVLNYSSSTASLQKLKSKITIIDFFGTWCAPCIKALPELANYKSKFKDDISILLVSTEDEPKLSKFITSRKPFAFPLVVDENNLFTNAFAPPSYPYTIVLDRDIKILLITNAADLSESILTKFMEEDKKPVDPAKEMTVTQKEAAPINNAKAFTGSNNALVKLSQDFMYAAKTNEPVANYTRQLASMSYETLVTELKTDDERKAFWINLYNAFTNASLHANPDQYKSRNKFFRNKNIVVAGKTFSLDKIEHGILRKSSIKWSLGYLSKLFPNKTEKELRVNKLDYRIHFALNCGARSCPPIAFYNPENLNSQLDLATAAYLTSETTYSEKDNKVLLPAILGWFRRDFGGKSGMIEILKAKQIIPSSANPKIKFKKYDWSLYLDNYKQ